MAGVSRGVPQARPRPTKRHNRAGRRPGLTAAAGTPRQHALTRQQRHTSRTLSCQAAGSFPDDSWIEASGDEAQNGTPSDDLSTSPDDEFGDFEDVQPDTAPSDSEAEEESGPDDGEEALELSAQDLLRMRGVPIVDLPPEPLPETDISAAPPRSLRAYVKKHRPPPKIPPGPFDGPDVEYGPWEEVQEGDEAADEDLYYHGLFADEYESDASDLEDPLDGPETMDPQQELLLEHGLRVDSLFREARFAKMRKKLQLFEAESLAASFEEANDADSALTEGLGSDWGRLDGGAGGSAAGGAWDDVSSNWAASDGYEYVDATDREAARASDDAVWAEGVDAELLGRIQDMEATAAAGLAPPLPPDPFDLRTALPEVGAAAAPTPQEEVAPADAMTYLPTFSLDHLKPDHELREWEELLQPKYEWNEWDQQAFDMQERVIADLKAVDERGFEVHHRQSEQSTSIYATTQLYARALEGVQRLGEGAPPDTRVPKWALAAFALEEQFDDWNDGLQQQFIAASEAAPDLSNAAYLKLREVTQMSEGDVDRRKLLGPVEPTEVLPEPEDDGSVAGIGDALEDFIEAEPPAEAEADVPV